MYRRSLFVISAFIVSLVSVSCLISSVAIADEKIPSKVDQSCLKCHEYDKQAHDLFAGKFKSASVKANCLQVQIDKGLEVITFDDETVLKNAPSIPEIPKEESIRVTVAKKDGKTYAKEIEVKKGLAVPAEQLITTEQVAELVAKGPEKGKYILLDSRPMERYNEGHIPTAVGMPFFAFDKLAEKLLKDKEVTQIYYCAGFSWVLSPLAARKAEKLGFKNVKVYHAGLPDWRKAGHLVVSNNAAIEEYKKVDASFIVIDVRPADQIAKGHIPNSVAIPKDGLDSLKDQFPKFMGAVIIVVDETGVSEASQKAFKTISDWGYKQTSILDNGFKGWQTAGNAIATGPAASTINYVRKLLPGEIELAAFKTLLEKPSPDTIVLDVRAASEVAEGKLPNTMQLPLDELEIRIGELPKDKRIIVHCATGARAEMAYNVLKNAGFNTGYVRATLSFDKDKPGTFVLEE